MVYSSFIPIGEIDSTLLTPLLECQTLNKNRGGALCTGADGPRAGAGQSAAWCEAWRCSLHRGGRSAAWCKARAPA
jgi:hypothetical protein